MGINIENAIAWMRARQGNVTYSMDHRDGPYSYDCSSSVYYALREAGAVSAGDVMIDGNAIGDVGNIVLRDRKVLSEDGIFIVALTVNRKEKKIISKAKVHTRGFVYVKKSRDILRESTDLINKTVEDYLAQESFDWGELKGAVRDSLAKFLFEQTKRRPAILPVVMEVR